MSRLWGWVVAAFGMLGAALLYVAGQRNRAREAAARAKAEAKGREIVQEVERAIDNARAKAREQAAEIQSEHDKHKASGTRPDMFGDDRLHNRRND